ncbi:MAG: hypothetical protein JSW12_11235, partial [Deltaproteobacteria bacterium]
MVDSVSLANKHSILLFALDITEKGVGWSQQERPHAPPDIADYLMLSVVINLVKNSRQRKEL